MERKQGRRQGSLIWDMDRNVEVVDLLSGFHDLGKKCPFFDVPGINVPHQIVPFLMSHTEKVPPKMSLPKCPFKNITLFF